MKNNIKITTINDEISDDLNETVDFLKQHKIKYIELRTIHKKNLIDYPLDEIKEIHKSLSRNNILVSAFASPLFKWYPSNTKTELPKKVDTFGFDPSLSFTEKRNYIDKAIAVANILRTPNIRIFSSLKTQLANYSFASDPLLEFALARAEKNGIVFLLENEPPCYFFRKSHIKFIIKKIASKNFKLWFDVANFYKNREQVLLKDLQELKNNIQYFHLKDFDEKGNYTAIGEGVINYKRIFSDIKEVFKDKKIFLSLETHVRSNPRGATEKSLLTLKNLLSEKRVGYGIIGCGLVFAKHASAVSQNKYSELRSVFDIDKKKAEKAAKQFDCESKSNLDGLLRDNAIDVVNIRTPNNTHTNLVLKTLERAKYCLSEKPLCLTTAEGKKILQSKFYKNNITVNFQNRFNPAVQKLLQYIEKQRLGKIILCSVDVHWWRNDEYFKDWHGDARKVGGMLFNQGAHAIDLVLQICGPVKKITKIKKSLRKFTNIDDIYLALLQFRSGVIGSIEITTYTKFQSRGTSLFVLGEKGSIKLGGPSFNKLEFLSGIKDLANIPTIADTPGEIEDSHFKLVKALNAHLLNGKRSRFLASAEDGVKVTEFIEKLYR